MYTPKWTSHLHAECTRNLLKNRDDLTKAQLQRTVTALRTAFPDAESEKYESLIAGLDLPDPDNRHTLAAVIRYQDIVIVTANLKNFSGQHMAQFDIETQHLDELIANLVDLNPAQALAAFQQQISFLKNPPRTATQILDNFRQVHLTTSTDKLASLL